MVLCVQFSHTDHWMFNMAPHGKELSEDLTIVAFHKDGRGYKISNNVKLSVARVIQRFSKTGFTRNRLRKGRSKMLSPCAVCQVQKLASKTRRMSAASNALEVAEGQLVSAQTIHHTLQQVGLLGRRHRRKPLLKLTHKKACKQFAEDNLAKSMDYWNHVLWSDESKVNMAQMVSSMCGDALVRSTKKIVSCVQSSMVVVASSSGAAWLLLVLGSCGSLRKHGFQHVL